MPMYDLPDERGPFRALWRPLCRRDADPGADRAEGSLRRAAKDPQFIAEFEYDLKHYVGRPSPIYHAKRWSELLGGAQIYLKREDLNHTGAHKVEQLHRPGMLARRMGKPRVIAETGAGQHGVATATVAARYGMECVVSWARGRQAPGRQRLSHEAARRYRRAGRVRLEDAEGCAERGDARLGHQRPNTFYIIGTVAGPHPYPMMVRDFQAVIGRECIPQMWNTGRQPDVVIAACRRRRFERRWGSSIPTSRSKRRHGRRRGGGRGLDSGRHAASLDARSPRRAARQPHLPAAGRGRPDHRDALDLRPASTIPASVRSTPTSRIPAAPNTSASPTPRRCRPSTTCAAPRASSRRWNRAMRWPMPPAGADAGRDQILLVNLSGRGDKDITPSPKIRHQVLNMSKIRRQKFRAPPGAGPQGADPVHHRRRSRCRADRSLAADA